MDFDKYIIVVTIEPILYTPGESRRQCDLMWCKKNDCGVKNIATNKITIETKNSKRYVYYCDRETKIFVIDPVEEKISFGLKYLLIQK
jgi:hypothetical protein